MKIFIDDMDEVSSIRLADYILKTEKEKRASKCLITKLNDQEIEIEFYDRNGEVLSFDYPVIVSENSVILSFK